MSFASYCSHVDSLPFGKKLPGATYLFRPSQAALPADLWNTVSRAETAARPDPAWNLLKLHTDKFAITFLTYPDFDTDPHPALAELNKSAPNPRISRFADPRKPIIVAPKPARHYESLLLNGVAVSKSSTG